MNRRGYCGYGGRPDAVLITPCQAKAASSPPCSHHILCSRHGTPQSSSFKLANRVRQPHQLNAKQWHVHLIEIKHCEGTRPGQRLEAAQRQHADLCKLISAKAATLHTILIGVSGICYIKHTLIYPKQHELDHRRAIKLAHRLHAHSLIYASNLLLVTTGRAIDNNLTSHSQILEALVEGIGGSSEPMSPFP
eukprot:1160429-Pelagomonas_calceolata.AAC.3